MSPPVRLRVAGVRHSYGSREVLRGASLSVAEAESVALLGPSGCGKTTLLHILALIEKPDSGEVWIGERDALRLIPRERAALRLCELGLVFQSHNLLSHLTTVENVALPRWRWMPDRKAATTRARTLLDELGLSQVADQPVRTLSVGEMQRAAVARALINEPRLLLCDEPTASLDEAAALSVLSALRSAQHRGTGILIVTHSSEVARRTDRILQLNRGLIA